jgi:hypothetical protein
MWFQGATDVFRRRASNSMRSPEPPPTSFDSQARSPRQARIAVRPQSGRRTPHHLSLAARCLRRATDAPASARRLTCSTPAPCFAASMTTFRVARDAPRRDYDLSARTQLLQKGLLQKALLQEALLQEAAPQKASNIHLWGPHETCLHEAPSRTEASSRKEHLHERANRQVILQANAISPAFCQLIQVVTEEPRAEYRESASVARSRVNDRRRRIATAVVLHATAPAPHSRHHSHLGSEAPDDEHLHRGIQG